ncbi:MAG: PHB depolymerase family esterase [Microbacteriaceae bacterium]
MRRAPRARAAGGIAVLVLGCVVAAASLSGCGQVESTPQAAATGQIAEADSGVMTLAVDGLERTAIVRDSTSSAIAQAANARVPALIVLHGASGSNTATETTTGLTALAEQDGFVVAYPRGTAFGRAVGGYAWNAGGCCGRPVTDDVDDVAFLSALIDELIAEHNVDPERVYLAGFSNGGMMAYRFACELGQRLAGIVVVSGALNVDSCVAPTALPVLIVHGTKDGTVPYDGGPPSATQQKRLGYWVNASVADATSFWSARDGCTSSTTASLGAVRTRVWDGCASGSALELVTIPGGIHRWPTTANESFDASAFLVDWLGLDEPTDPFQPADPAEQEPPVRQATGTATPAG